ncbi:MAG: prepilin-type N-terminal cleavage/methylation domain-containing protein [Phycisphaerae bacterium]|nr:prepilin-type N-terminal cleavage/methylation domain-containing protein [Phycisphaerae bacterium]
MSKTRSKQNKGFSLLELVVVVVIIGIIAVIAIPRMSRGSAGAADAALSGDLAVLRNAIDLYAIEHTGSFPTKTDIQNQLLQYTNNAGTAQASRDATHIYGPYMRKVPPLPVGAKKGQSGISDIDGTTVGWIYNETTGDIRANTTTEMDVADKLYSDY